MYELSDTQIAGFLRIGIRPISVPEKFVTGDILGGFVLIPTFKGEWVRQHAKQINSTWEGSYIPLIIYRNKTATILVDYKEVALWEELRGKIEAILEIPVNVRGD